MTTRPSQTLPSPLSPQEPVIRDKNRHLYDERPLMAMESNWADGTSTGWHTHSRGQLLYAIAGVMLVQSDAGAWVVPPNRALWLAEGVLHEVRMAGAVQMRTVYIDASRVRGLPVATGVLHVSPLLRELIVATVATSQQRQNTLRERLLMRLLVEEIAVSDVLPLHLPVPVDARIRQICEGLMADIANADTAEQWAARLGITAKTVHRLFVQETGMTFAQWREQARLVFALRQIASGARIIDIAFDCGYASQSAFSAMFRRHFGVPPSAMFR
ncbi:AraC family transcriptional regulator [Comamonas serinivorans]|uniref:AraC family transcriptional regulator n=1 Tax=Comamonas serinivorans TaxID=1082851 RepID=A0A1Y0ENC2_9BURK|nr:helix-turn-helix transcriptional regulator [Comamonas serinivorans]ARU04940.1 AraC family transcriptional regulator [Comamonas serinivorans]